MASNPKGPSPRDLLQSRLAAVLRPYSHVLDAPYGVVEGFEPLRPGFAKSLYAGRADRSLMLRIVILTTRDIRVTVCDRAGDLHTEQCADADTAEAVLARILDPLQ